MPCRKKWRPILTPVMLTDMKERSVGAPLIIILALLLPALYVGTYAAIYDPNGPLAMQDTGRCEVQNYPYANGMLKIVFAPLESLDWRTRK